MFPSLLEDMAEEPPRESLHSTLRGVERSTLWSPNKKLPMLFFNCFCSSQASGLQVCTLNPDYVPMSKLHLLCLSLPTTERLRSRTLSPAATPWYEHLVLGQGLPSVSITIIVAQFIASHTSWIWQTPVPLPFPRSQKAYLLFLWEYVGKRIQLKSPDAARYATIMFPPKNNDPIKTCRFTLQVFPTHFSCLRWECRQHHSKT